jgi:CHAT domain-containing protein
MLQSVVKLCRLTLILANILLTQVVFSKLKKLGILIKQDLKNQADNFREEANDPTIDLHPPYADPYHWAAFTLTGIGSL